jgi:hypothetical protein
MKNKWFYEKNNHLLCDETVNLKFEEVLGLTNDEFESWIKHMRSRVCEVWDTTGTPPTVGYSEDEIIDQFNKLECFPVHEFISKDLLTNSEDVIRNTSIIGNAVNSWFPTMMATKINYTSDVNSGVSIYDHFKDDALLDKVIKYGRRHFKRDSFYHYSQQVKAGDSTFNIKSDNAINWIKGFESTIRCYGKYDYWLEPIESDKGYSGYNDELRSSSFLHLSLDEFESIKDLIPELSKSNIEIKPGNAYAIRLFDRSVRIFPLGFKAFKVSWCQYAHNYPALTAKFLYERYTEEFKNDEEVYIWDPSCGWGGRLLGAMSISQDRKVHYIGTDPNTDHNTTNGRTKYHELADFYNKKTKRAKGLLDSIINTYEIHQCGSEVFHNTEAFNKYKGKVSVAFTSPPYFAKEAYSQDETQSYKKFSQYESWRDEFLQQTIKNAYDILRIGGYLIWNIADAKFGNLILPLEGDSIKFALECGFDHIHTWKMSLAQMPGGNRVDPETGLPMTKNFCKIHNSTGKSYLWLKYEPIFVFRKK